MYEIALLLSLVTLLGVSIFFVRSAAFSLFHPLTFYVLFHGAVFVIRPILSYFLKYEQIYRGYQFNPSMDDKLTVLFASNLGFVVFAFFALRAGGVAMQFKFDKVAEAERDRLSPVFLWVSAACAPIAAFSLAKVWSGAAAYGEGYEGMVRDAATGVFINTVNNGYLMEAQLMLASCCAIIAWLFRFRLLALTPLLIFAIFRAGTGGRGPFITALVTVGLLWLYSQRRRFPTLRVGLLLLCLVPIFTAIGTDRGASIRRTIGTEASSEIFGTRYEEAKFMESMDYGNMEYFEYLVYAIPQRTGTYGYFVDNLQILTEPIPRVLWKSKPVGAPFNRIFLFDYGNPIGMTRSLPGQGWYSLGWIGVVVWCALWGWVLGLIYRRFVEGPQGTFHVAAYMVFLPILIVAYRDGQIITIFRQGLFFFAPIVLWLLFARRLHIPSAAQVRAGLRRARRNSWVEPIASGAAAAELDELAKLADSPAPVQRRRRALRGAGSFPA